MKKLLILCITLFLALTHSVPAQINSKEVDTAIVNKVMKEIASLNYSEADFNKMKLYFKSKEKFNDLMASKASEGDEDAIGLITILNSNYSEALNKYGKDIIDPIIHSYYLSSETLAKFEKLNNDLDVQIDSLNTQKAFFEKEIKNTKKELNNLSYDPSEIKHEMLRSWNAYKTYAWGDDVLLPLSKSGFNWYKESLGISPIDAYSTLAVMELNKEAKEVEDYALSMDWDKDVYVQLFEVNIRILGGLLAIYDFTQNPEILKKAIDFGNRLLPAFNSNTGIPYHSVNLKTGKTSGNKGVGKGNVVNTAQAATYLLEFGILSYYSKDPKYYQTAKKATIAVFNRKSKIGLPGDYINVETGEWTNNWSYIQAGMDSYYEYLFKSNLLFPDPEIESIWEFSLSKINTYLAEDYNGKLFYKCVNMNDGSVLKRSMSLYDAFFPAVQALHGDIKNAEKNMATWDWLWEKYNLLPTRYLYEDDKIEYANSELNPEIVESAYYLHQITGDEKYLKMIQKYWADIKSCCRNEIAFNAVEDVRTMEAKDYLATYFYAETLKYFYLASVDKETFNFNDYIFNTEAHPFKKSHFDSKKINIFLAIDN